MVRNYDLTKIMHYLYPFIKNMEILRVTLLRFIYNKLLIYIQIFIHM